RACDHRSTSAVPPSELAPDGAIARDDRVRLADPGPLLASEKGPRPAGPSRDRAGFEEQLVAVVYEPAAVCSPCEGCGPDRVQVVSVINGCRRSHRGGGSSPAEHRPSPPGQPVESVVGGVARGREAGETTTAQS